MFNIIYEAFRIIIIMISILLIFLYGTRGNKGYSSDTSVLEEDTAIVNKNIDDIKVNNEELVNAFFNGDDIICDNTTINTDRNYEINIDDGYFYKENNKFKFDSCVR